MKVYFEELDYAANNWAYSHPYATQEQICWQAGFGYHRHLNNRDASLFAALLTKYVQKWDERAPVKAASA